MWVFHISVHQCRGFHTTNEGFIHCSPLRTSLCADVDGLLCLTVWSCPALTFSVTLRLVALTYYTISMSVCSWLSLRSKHRCYCSHCSIFNTRWSNKNPLSKFALVSASLTIQSIISKELNSGNKKINYERPGYAGTFTFLEISLFWLYCLGLADSILYSYPVPHYSIHGSVSDGEWSSTVGREAATYHDAPTTIFLHGYGVPGTHTFLQTREIG